MRREHGAAMVAVGRAAALAVLLAMMAVTAARAADTALGEARAQMVPTGKLRAAIGIFDPALATKDGSTGELAGVTPEIASVLAQRLGVPLQPVVYESATAYAASIGSLKWDISLVGREVSGPGRLDYSAPFMLVENQFLAQPGKVFRDFAEIDRKGVRVGVTIDSPADLILTRKLANAQIFRVLIGTAAAGLTLRASGADVFAGSVPFLSAVAAEVPGSRFVDQPLGVTAVAIGVAPGRPAALAYVNDFLREAKASGLVRQAIERAGLRGVQIAPP